MPCPQTQGILLDAMALAQEALHIEGHISARDVVDGLVFYAADTWGCMGALVLEHLGLTTSESVGATLWNMVDANMIAKEPEDSIDDFTLGRYLCEELALRLEVDAPTPKTLREWVAKEF